jgi:hypothetical protein
MFRCHVFACASLALSGIAHASHDATDQTPLWTMKCDGFDEIVIRQDDIVDQGRTNDVKFNSNFTVGLGF